MTTGTLLDTLETAQQSLVEAPETFDPDDFESWPLERPRAAYRAAYEGGRSGIRLADAKLRARDV